MHAYVVQLSETPFEDAEDFITEDVFYDTSFIGEVADYVQNISEKGREEAIKSFLEMCAQYGAEVGEGFVVFTKEFKENYFRNRFDDLKNLVEQAELKEFSEDSNLVYMLKKLIEDKYDMYIYFFYPQTLDSFIRGAFSGIKYYVGGVVDYHY